MQKITTFLGFADQAEEAVRLYTSVFKNSRILRIRRYGEAGPGPKGAVMTIDFELDGQTFYALNGGSYFTFAPGISLFVNCETQAEVDALWEKLSEGGKKERCGWLTDRFGVSWQIVPAGLRELVEHEDPATAARAMRAMMTMDKLDIAAMRRAVEGA
jgi:predicted 3-demethylubiquinone-9 3-methyltransferase (glyoxalase superfamily)